MKNLTVLIGSCDSYHRLWKPFQICFDRYWKHDTKNLFVTENDSVPGYTPTEFVTLTPGNLSWGERMYKALDSIDTDYVFWILEDYFFDYTYTKEELENYLEFMKSHNVDRLQISPSGHQKYTDEVIKGFTKFADDSNYLISLQPSIWSVDFIKKVLDTEYSPWDFEIKGSNKLKNTVHNIFIDTNKGGVYFNAVRKGLKKSKGWDNFFKKENLDPISL